MYEAIAFIAGIVLGVLLIEVIDLHRNRVELEKLQDKEIEETEEAEETKAEEVEEADEEIATCFTVCLTGGKVFQVIGDSVGSNINGKFVIYRGPEDNIVFSTNTVNVDWWGESDSFELIREDV